MDQLDIGYSEEDRDIFSATTTEISHITAVLSAISVVGTQGNIYIGPDGLIFTCENVHTIRVSATFDKKLFDNYYFDPPEEEVTNNAAGNNNESTNATDISSDDEGVSNLHTQLTQQVKNIRKRAQKTIEICVDLKKVVESFNIASSLGGFSKEADLTIKCTLSYKGRGHPFVVSFRDPMMTERCEFATFVDLEEHQFLMLDVSSLVMEVILSADVIHDALNNLKDLNSEEIYIYASSRATDQRTLDKGRVISNQLMFISKGEIGFSRFIFPSLEKLELRQYDPVNYEFRPVKNDFIVSVYKFDIFKKIMRSVKLSSKIRIRKDSKGIISIHLLTAYNIDNTAAIFSNKVNSGFRGNNQHQHQQKERMPVINKNRPPYEGTVIEFILLELAVDEDEDDATAKSEIIDLIRHAENVSTINPRNKRKRQSMAQKKSAPQNNDNDIMNILQNNKRLNAKDMDEDEGEDKNGDSESNNIGNNIEFDSGRRAPQNGLGIINTTRGINEILHEITNVGNRSTDGSDETGNGTYDNGLGVANDTLGASGDADDKDVRDDITLFF